MDRVAIASFCFGHKQPGFHRHGPDRDRFRRVGSDCQFLRNSRVGKGGAMREILILPFGILP